MGSNALSSCILIQNHCTTHESFMQEHLYDIDTRTLLLFSYELEHRILNANSESRNAKLKNKTKW